MHEIGLIMIEREEYDGGVVNRLIERNSETIENLLIEELNTYVDYAVFKECEIDDFEGLVSSLFSVVGDDFREPLDLEHIPELEFSRDDYGNDILLLTISKRLKAKSLDSYLRNLQLAQNYIIENKVAILKGKSDEWYRFKTLLNFKPDFDLFINLSFETNQEIACCEFYKGIREVIDNSNVGDEYIILKNKFFDYHW